MSDPFEEKKGSGYMRRRFRERKGRLPRKFGLVYMILMSADLTPLIPTL